ncbi:MAG: serine/threonine-protein kinase PknK, partial [Symploca sp. SIO1A3]|nr:serine/threonine-protein kinase PknK [Symploca sp. SIO1A3]
MNSTIAELPGYCFIEPIYQCSRTLVYRGERSDDHKRVILKLLKSEYPSFQELVQFRHQYTIAKHLNLPGIVQPIALLNYRHSLVLVMEDDGSISLTDYIRKTQLSLSEFLLIAIEITEILQGLYSYRIIHKDLKPSNILINPSTLQVKLIDFSLASFLPRENQEIHNPNVLEGTLGYISPEQTGRMNRGIDYRTDFYSLGVTFYELLTGQLPFQSTDRMELVHCHLAKKPTPPVELNPAIGVMVNKIVMKLMAKRAEERYQSALGLKYDLEKCLHQWETLKKIPTFELGSRDIGDRFVIPEKLYGRETEVTTLLAAFRRVSAGSREMLLVAGFSGIGKTAVVNEVHKPIVQQRGYFIQGKFDQLQRNIPLSALVQACRNLMEQLLTETDAQIQQWKTKILLAVGENGQVIIDIIPEVQLLIGKQPTVPELSSAAAQNRFNLLFQKFIRVFTGAEHPLVIFLDDLQWADSASLQLMQLLMSETDTRYLLLIGAYRDNEVSQAHPLMLTLEEIKQAGGRRQEAEGRRQEAGGRRQEAEVRAQALIHTITLKPLQKTDLNQLITDTLSCSFELALPLTELIYQKTQGNPFFSNQFLKALHEDGLIAFNLEAGCWQCDIAQVKAMASTDDVVEFMALQLQKLPAATQEVLKLAACIGNQFELETLAIVSEKSLTETATNLWKALEEGLILPKSEVYKFFPANKDSVTTEEDSPQFPIPHSLSPIPYRFLHDRVQQAAYFLIPEQHKQSTHLQIGRLLLNNTLSAELKRRQKAEGRGQKVPTRTPAQEFALTEGNFKPAEPILPIEVLEKDSTKSFDEELFPSASCLLPSALQGESLVEDKIFEIVNQLNLGVELITSPRERNQLAQLNLIAGNKAKAATATAAAIGYLTVGIGLLAADSWHNQYQLTLTLYESAAEAAYLSGEFEQMEQLIDTVLQQAKTLLDKVKVYEVKLQAGIAQHQQLAAVETGLTVLKLLGVSLPQEPHPQDIELGLQELQVELTKRRQKAEGRRQREEGRGQKAEGRR